MRILCFEIKMLTFRDVTGVTALEKEIQKLRELRDSYRESNKAYYGDYLASLLND